jgi:hypothetical protein
LRATAPAAIIIGLGDPPVLTLIAALLIQIVARYAIFNYISTQRLIALGNEFATRETALVFARRKPGLALEQPTERAEIAVADAFAADFHLLGLQQPLGDVDTQRLQILQWRLAQGLLEAPVERALTGGEMPRELAEIETRCNDCSIQRWARATSGSECCSSRRVA